MQLTAEQLRQLERTLIASRAGFRQLAIVAADGYLNDLRARGRLATDEALDEYVARVSEPFIRPLDEALRMLEASR